jgi:hypothetical protein
MRNLIMSAAYQNLFPAPDATTSVITARIALEAR